jgi:hypothetical protein
MDEHKELRTMIEEGKDKLEWYRQVDPAKLNTLKELINAPNYKENMATLIRYFVFYSILITCLPRGQSAVSALAQRTQGAHQCAQLQREHGHPYQVLLLVCDVHVFTTW